MKIAVFDIDGVLINSSQRIHLWDAGSVDEYHAAVVTDEPIHAGFELLKMVYYSANYQVLFVTSRGDEPNVKRITMQHLREWSGIHWHREQLIMRSWQTSKEDRLPCHVWKPRAIEAAGYHLADVAMVFEDDDKISDVWAARGVPVFKTIGLGHRSGHGLGR